MKLTRAEIGALVVTLVFAALASGYVLAQGGRSADFIIKTEKQATTAELMAGGDVTVRVEAEAGAVPASEKLNINTATADELAKLPGIGGVLAGRIVEYRTQNGVFEHTQDIMDVYGIGEAIYNSISSMITVD